MMSILAVGGTLAAIGVGLNGYRKSPKPEHPLLPSVATAAAVDDDPMAPRLFDQGQPLRIHVVGAVRKPGVYSLPSWSRVNDAMKKAGGPTPLADLEGINLADRLQDGEQLRIPRIGRPEDQSAAHRPTPEPPQAAEAAGGHRSGRFPFARPSVAVSAVERPAGPVNLNTADAAALETLPGVGPSTSAKIIKYRTEFGPFQKPEDLMNVAGIGPTRFERMRPLIQSP
jgi:competence protein ComEA